MKVFTLLLISISINLYSQNNYPIYTPEMFRSDTANIAKFAIDLPIEKKAELYALAELWAIEDSYSNHQRPDTIYKHDYETPKKQKKKLKELKKEFLLTKKHIYNYRFYGGWQLYYFFDINKDGKIDIIKVHRSCEDSIEHGYPHVSCNFYTTYLSTQSKFYNKYSSTGRITVIKEIQNEYYFTTIGYDCCDQIGTDISIFHIPKNSHEYVYDYVFWGRFLAPNKNIRYNRHTNDYVIPENLIEPKYYILCADIKINVGNIDEWDTFLTFKKNSVVRVFSNEKNFYFVELKVKKEMNKNISKDFIYVIKPYMKTEFETFAESLD